MMFGFGSKKNHRGSLFSGDHVSDDYKELQKKKAAKEKAEREKEEEERKKREREEHQRQADESIRLGNGDKGSKRSEGGGFFGSGW
jgi:hypothetical protein